MPTDADDDAAIATALAADGTQIVTGDSDLLVMDPFRGMQILAPTSALHLVEKYEEHLVPCQALRRSASSLSFAKPALTL